MSSDAAIYGIIKVLLIIYIIIFNINNNICICIILVMYKKIINFFFRIINESFKQIINAIIHKINTLVILDRRFNALKIMESYEIKFLDNEELRRTKLASHKRKFFTENK